MTENRAPGGGSGDDILMIFIASSASASETGQPIFQFSPDTADLEDSDRFQAWLARMTEHPSIWTRLDKMRQQRVLEDFKSGGRTVTFFVSATARKRFSDSIRKEHEGMFAVPPCAHLP